MAALPVDHKEFTKDYIFDEKNVNVIVVIKLDDRKGCIQVKGDLVSIDAKADNKKGGEEMQWKVTYIKKQTATKFELKFQNVKSGKYLQYNGGKFDANGDGGDDSLFTRHTCDDQSRLYPGPNKDVNNASMPLSSYDGGKTITPGGGGKYSKLKLLYN